MANYTGQNLGANRVDRIKLGVRQCSILTLGFSLFAFLIVQLFAEPLVAMFDIERGSAIMDYALQYLRLASFLFPFLFILFVHRNVLQGVGRSFMPLMAGVFELVARAVVAFLLPGVLGYAGICLAGPAAWVTAAVVLFISYQVVIRQIEKQYATS